MLNILIVENRRRGEGAMDRAVAVAEMFTDKSLTEEKINVEIVENVAAAKKKMQLETVHAVIFLTKSMELALKKLAFTHPATKIFVFTDRIPDKKVIWVEREWLSPELFQGLVNTMKP